LTFTGTGTKTPQGSLKVDYDLTVNRAGQTVDLSNFSNHVVSGNVTITAGTLNLNSSTLKVAGSITGAGTFSGGTGTLVINGNSAHTIGVTTQTFNNINMAAGFANLTSAATMNGNLTIDSSTEFIVNGVNFTQNGTTTISGVLTHSSATGVKTYVGPVTINSGGTWYNWTDSNITFRGGIINNSTATIYGSSFVAGSGQYTFNTNNQSIGGSAAISIPNVAVTGVTLTNNNAAGLTVGTALSGTGGLTQGTDAILNIGSTLSISTLNASASGNTVNYSGTSQSVKPATYHNLKLAGSGIKTLTGVSTINGDLTLLGAVNASTTAAMTIGGDLTVSAGTGLTVGTGNFTVNGTAMIYGNLDHNSPTGIKTYVGPVAISSGGAWNDSGNANLVFRGGLTHNGTTFTSGSGVYTFDTNDQSIGGLSNVTIQNLEITGINLTNNNVNVLGLTVSTALSGTGTTTQGANSILRIFGTNDVTGFDATASGNTIGYYSTTDPQTVRGGTYHNLSIVKAGQVATLGGGIIANGNITILAGQLDTSASNYPITVKGDWTNGGSGFNTRHSTVTFNGTGNSQIVGGNTWYNLVITASTTRTVFFPPFSTQQMDVGGSLTMVGEPTHILSLASSNSPNQWVLNLDSSVTQNISYVAPSDSDASGGYTIVATNVTDNGNNLNWGASSVSCSTNISSTDFGIIDPSSVTTAATHATTTVSCGATGCALYVHDTGNGSSPGLYSSTATSTPLIPSLTTTLSPGTEGYGIQVATSTDGTGNILGVNPIYSTTGNGVGGLSTTDAVLASSSSALDSRVVVVKHKVSVGELTTHGSYSDTITYSCLAN
jgi:hypothetical protein